MLYNLFSLSLLETVKTTYNIITKTKCNTMIFHCQFCFLFSYWYLSSCKPSQVEFPLSNTGITGTRPGREWPLEDQTYTVNWPLVCPPKVSNAQIITKMEQEKKWLLFCLWHESFISQIQLLLRNLLQAVLRKNMSIIWGGTIEANMNNHGKARGKNPKILPCFLQKLE